MADALDLILVGAGVAGLQALAECLKLGLKVKALEKDATPGGKWSGHGIYECVQIQQHKEDFFIPGVEWTGATPDFPTRDDVLSALENFVAENKLREHIVCRAKVISTVFDAEKGLWTTKTGAGGEYRSRYIAFAVGTLGTPIFPPQVTEALAAFEGDVVHSHGYYRPLPYEGKHVIVLGYGASSVEIAQDLARNGACASVSLVAPPKVRTDGRRSGQDWCLSRVLPGAGSRFCSQGQEDSPGSPGSLECRNRLVREAMRERHPKYPECMPEKLRPSGELEGRPLFPGEDGRPLGGRVIVSEGFLECVAEGSISSYPGFIGASDAKHVIVTNEGDADVMLRADAVVVCTGYEAPTRRIVNLMSPPQRSCESLYKGMWMTDAPNAALMGHVYGFVAAPPFAGAQARFLARVVAGREQLPDSEAMRAWVHDTEDKFTVTQRLTENSFFKELRTAALGSAVVARDPVGAGPPRRGACERLLAKRELPCALLAGAAAGLALAVAAPKSGVAAKVGVPGLAAALAAAAVASVRRRADDACATAAAEALLYLEEDRAALGEVSVVAIGCPKAASVLRQRLREEERGRMCEVLEKEVCGPWGAADASVDTVLCAGGLDGKATGPGFVAEAQRVLKRGGHAVVTLKEVEASGAWIKLFDEAERPVNGGGWRMVHKTAPRSGSGGAFRCYVFRRC